MKRTLRLSQDYPHPPELVWRVLTEPALIGEWLMDNDFAPVVGHTFTLRTRPAPGFDGIVHCEVLSLAPPHAMRWSWRGGPIDTVVSFTLSPVPVGAVEGTRLAVEQTGFAGLAPVLVSFILGAGNRGIYRDRLPRLLETLSGAPPRGSSPHRTKVDSLRPHHTKVDSLPPHRTKVGWLLVKLFAPILRRAERRRRQGGGGEI
jgi:uncharacterized protein YndB with AHSA1/START domain